MARVILIIAFLSCFSTLTSQELDGGNGHAIILDSKGDVYTIGRNTYGQLGDSSFQSSSTPIKVIKIPKIKSISRGYNHSIAIDSAGNLWTWGRNNYGQLGTSLPDDYNFPQMLRNHSNFATAEGGHWHTVALKLDGSVWVWGHNFYGELGNGTREHSNIPTQVVDSNGNPLTNISQISSVGYHTLAVDSNGHVFSWGGNDFLQLGYTQPAIQPFAKKIKNLKRISQVATGWHHSIALDSNGNIYAWGSIPSKMKEGKITSHRQIDVITGLPKIKKIACGSWHSLAIDSAGNLWTWGRNDYGMLGDGSNANSDEPIKIKGVTDVISIGAGCFQSLASDSKGNIWTFGDNFDGQQGQGNNERLLIPKRLSLIQLPEKNKYSIFKKSSNLLFLILGISLLLNGFLLFKLKNRG